MTVYFQRLQKPEAKNQAHQILIDLIMTYIKLGSTLLLFVVIIFTFNSIQSTSAASSNVRTNENPHRLHTRPFFRLAQRPMNQYNRIKDDFLDDDELFELNKRQTSDDYGHLRFGKRDEFDDYGHMRFGRSGPEASN